MAGITARKASCFKPWPTDWEFAGHRPVFGIWMVDHEAAGLGIREDTRVASLAIQSFRPALFPANVAAGVHSNQPAVK